MLAVRLLRFGLVKKPKGPLHDRLHALLVHAWRSKAITQDSLAKAIGYTQENAGQYLRGGKAGALNLDQADAALRHIGSSLSDFIAGIEPRELSAAERVARQLEVREESVVKAVAAMLAVPQKRLPVLLELISAGFYAATGQRLTPPGESESGSTQAGRTTKAPRKRR